MEPLLGVNSHYSYSKGTMYNITELIGLHSFSNEMI